jgi:hypothetical protein
MRVDMNKRGSNTPLTQPRDWCAQQSLNSVASFLDSVVRL